MWRTVDFEITHQNRNQHITMCPCIKLTLDVRTKFTQDYMNDKILKKIFLKS